MPLIIPHNKSLTPPYLCVYASPFHMSKPFPASLILSTTDINLTLFWLSSFIVLWLLVWPHLISTFSSLQHASFRLIKIQSHTTIVVEPPHYRSYLWALTVPSYHTKVKRQASISPILYQYGVWYHYWCPHSSEL